MSISEELNKIKNAIYGREVRDAIHDGIKKAYDDASQGGNTNMEVSLARGGFQTLNERLTNVDGMLNSVNTQLPQKVGGGNKAELEDLSPTVLSAIEGGEGTEFNLLSIPQDKSVTEKKTTFFKKTRNLFEGIYLPYRVIGSGSANLLRNADDNDVTTFTEIEPDTEYTIRVIDANDSDTWHRMLIAETTIHYDDLEFNPTNDRATLLSSVVSVTNTPEGYTFTTRSDTKYLYVFVAQNNHKPRFQVEKGNEATEYIVPYVFPIDLIDGLEDIDFGGQPKEQKLADLMWTWHTFPMSIYSERANKTFLGGVRRGTAGGTSGHNIYSIDEETNKITGNQLSERFSGDDHNMVALADLPWRDQVMAFYAGHSGPGIYYKFINGYDVNNLSEEKMIPNSEGSTYINIHHAQGSDTLYIISRVTSVGSWAIYYTDDFGETWNHKQLFTGNIYVDTGKRRRRDGNLGITVTGHGGTGFPEIYYCYLTLEGTIHLPNGTQIADVKTGEGLPLERTDLKLVAENTGSKTTVTSVNGNNHRLTFIHAPDEENFETFNYKFAIYNSDTDEFDEYLIEEGVKGNLMGTTHPHYVGSCYDVGFNNPHIYFSNYNDDTGKWEIWEYSNRNTIPDTGWNKVKMAESHLKLFRPIGVMYDFNARKPIPGFWLKGYFTHYEEYYADAQMPFNIDDWDSEQTTHQ